ncbi:ABC-type transport system involved in cytochrome c biogenesis permease subunit [Pseudomonas nitritireducens]|uniref:ABC-type transport system involved in cytochrome c biogenesis permease subunit n=1 Tax=Pseudomonas nitroreducens TaxID=46680 RepID=A0A7W7KIA3_PSENT|nr:peptidase M48, Ste24p [Pseudomonas nitritireducens]MBB4863335.1 ABC-type transport system involved in cytochrome c biogenesis permease subunit [Pseudomonas nitritireducens]
MEPTTSLGIGALFAKYSVAIASFWGSILSLGLLKGLSRKQAAMAVLTGYLFSTYMTAPVAAYFAPKLGLELDETFLCGTAFALGLTAMNIIPGLKALAERVLPQRGA